MTGLTRKLYIIDS